MFQSLAQSLADPLVLAALAIGYLLGSIPFGLLLSAAAGKGDIRKIGSGNIGATNVLRTGNKPLAALTLFPPERGVLTAERVIEGGAADPRADNIQIQPGELLQGGRIIGGGFNQQGGYRVS